MHGGNLGMAKTGRKRAAVVREDNGRAQRERERSPTAIRRLMDAALSDMRDPQWGTSLGRLLLTSSITETMYDAGKRWVAMATKYQQSIGIFPVHTAQMEAGRRGMAPDPDTPEGQKIVEREANGAERYFEADTVLAKAGRGIRTAVRRVCEDNETPCGFDELARLRTGLMHLASLWNLTEGNKSVKADVRNAR